MSITITFALRGTPRIIWIDTGLNITRADKDLIQYELKVVSALNIKFSAIKFKVTLPKHHEGIRAVERVIGVIKNTVSKSTIGPNQVKMSDKELLKWLSLVIKKLNDRPLILGTPLGITLTPNHVLQGSGILMETKSTQRLQFSTSSTVCSPLDLWIQEFTCHNFLIVWKEQGQGPELGDIVLFRNEPCYKLQLSAARIMNLLKCKKC